MKILPYKYNILVRVLDTTEEETKTKSGIVVINTNSEKPYIKCEVVAVGDDLNQLEDVDFNVNVGEIIYVQPMTGIQIESIKSGHMLITPDKIICKEVPKNE